MELTGIGIDFVSETANRVEVIADELEVADMVASTFSDVFPAESSTIILTLLVFLAQRFRADVLRICGEGTTWFIRMMCSKAIGHECHSDSFLFHI